MLFLVKMVPEDLPDQLTKLCKINRILRPAEMWKRGRSLTTNLSKSLNLSLAATWIKREAPEPEFD